MVGSGGVRVEFCEAALANFGRLHLKLKASVSSGSTYLDPPKPTCFVVSRSCQFHKGFIAISYKKDRFDGLMWAFSGLLRT